METKTKSKFDSNYQEYITVDGFDIYATEIRDIINWYKHGTDDYELSEEQKQNLGEEVIINIVAKRKKKLLDFISDIFIIEGKDIPELQSGEEIISLYQGTVKRLTEELMWSRNIPIPLDKLNKLRKVNNLPKSTKIILDSIE